MHSLATDDFGMQDFGMQECRQCKCTIDDCNVSGGTFIPFVLVVATLLI